MASQVLSGSSNVSYTNNTGQNVRIVINYMRGRTVSTSSGTTISTITISWAGASASAPITAIGRNLAFSVYDRFQSTGNTTIGQGTANTAASNAFIPSGTITSGGSGSTLNFAEGALPTELMLAPGQSFSASCEAYNVVIIPEAG